MLLEYHIDTQEDDLYPSSIELRKRFAQRKLHSAPVDDKTLISFKEANRSERREHGREVTAIINTEMSNRVALTRASHQLQLHKHLKNLEGDVARASRLSRTRLDALNDLESRITALRSKLQSSREEPTVEQKVANELSTNNKLKLEKMFHHCPRCKRKVLAQLFDVHSKACERLGGKPVAEDQEPVYDVTSNPIIELTTSLPQPPRNIKLVSKGCSHIEFAWEAPVFTGGLVITQYEIAYNRLDVWFDKESKMTIKKVVEQPNILTSHWCLLSPICHNGYKITNLQAASIYMDFKLRCYNLRGPSEWVNMYGAGNMITCDEADAPWLPLFFDITKVTSTCVHLTWQEPFFDGGSPVVDYIVFYTVIERHISATSRNHMVPVDKKYKIGSNETSFVIRHIPSSTDVKNIKVKAVNAVGLVGEAAVITAAGGVVTTKECSRCIAVRKELESVLKNPNEFIDTDFYSATVQRMHKKDYISKLKKELTIAKPTDEEYEEERIWRQIVKAKRAEKERLEAAQRAAEELEISSDEDTPAIVALSPNKKKEQTDFSFPYRVRKKHFKHRLQYLESLINALTKERSDIDSTRIELTAIMNDKQKRLIELDLERDRAASFTGEKITSSVLQGVMMTYLIATFKYDLNKTWEACLSEIAHMKHVIITGEKRKIEIANKISETKAEWQEKIAAFSDFTKKHDVKQKTLHKLVHGSTREELLRKHFHQMRKFTVEQLALKRQIAKAFHNVEKRFLASAFERWSTGRFGTNSELLSSGGAGSAMLQRARDYRLQVQSALRETIAFTSEIQNKLTIAKWNKTQRDTLVSSDHLRDMEEGVSQVSLEAHGMHFLYEGDGYALENKFAEAENCYEAQIISLRSIQPVNIKMLAVCHGRLGKLFLRQERFDRSILEFDRQLALAREIDNKVEFAEAYFGLGTGYLGKFDYLEAIRYLEIAHGRFDILGHLAKKCGAMVVLKECYSRLNKQDLVELYGNKIDVIEGELSAKLNKINEKLEDMTNRLRKTAAVVEFEIPIERIGLKTLQLRDLLSHLNATLAEQEEELDAQKLVTGNIERLLEDIQGELNMAVETDELEMMSYLVHDRPQMIDVEELKSRLHQRRLQVLEDFKSEKQTENAIATRIRNTEDNILGAEKDLAVENGVLMSHARQSKPFRCMVFDPANAAGDEVTGIATGGVENFVACESNNVHLIDFHNGELLQLYMGDERDKFGDERHGHTAIVTCLAYDNNRIYSGSMDETIMVWDVLQKERVMVITGHDGSVVSLAVQGAILFSGGADTTIRMWNKTTGYQIRIITGHTQSVLSIQAGINWMVTASADEEVRVWDIKPKTKGVSVETKMRLIGHETAVTVAKYGKLEVISGDKLGVILIWMLENGEIVRRIKAHKGAILTLQFDATRVVSGGADGNVCVSDIGTGEVLQTLYGHTAHVLALAFDTQRILTVGRDNMIRYWSWGGRKAEPPDKYHVMSKTDTLLAIANQYKIEMSELMTWNGITAVRQCYPGMRLIVRKGNAEKKTAAEIAAEEKTKRMQSSAALTKKRMKQNMIDSGNNFGKYNRVYKLATDIDTFSLGNRLFGKEKRQNELYPEKLDVDIDRNSLSYRLRRDVYKASNANRIHARYFPSVHNEDEWGHVADALGESMLNMFVEHMAYEVYLELRKAVRDPLSVYGRMTASEAEKRDKTKAQTQSRAATKRKKYLRQTTGSIVEPEENLAVIEEKSEDIFSEDGDRGARIESDSDGDD